MRASWIVVVIAAACGAPAGPVEPPSVAVEARSATPPAQPEPAHRAEPEVLRLDAVACSASTRTIYGFDEEDPTLCDARLGRCFLAFDGVQPTEMTVSIGVGDAPKGFVEIRYRGLDLRGFFDLRRAILYPRADLLLAGFFRPRQVGVLGATQGKLVVSGDPGPEVRTDAALSAELGCDEVAWSQDTWEEPAEIDKRLGAKGKGEYVRIVARTELLASPGGPRLATVEPGAETLVSGYQSQKGARFITMWSEGGDVFGWVREVDVVPASTGSGWGASGGGRGFAPIKTEWYGYRCAHDVPLVARVDGGLLEIGRVPARSVFSVDGELAPGLLRVVVRHQRFSDFGEPPELRTPKRIRLVNGAELAVERNAVRDCERRVPGEP
ncbi:MAG: hypothetical protein JNL21_17120 [Myxococcales bacterium]|nr:hypothetical protein [Myxococcales bacterium]